jgi:hypothetical protein
VTDVIANAAPEYMLYHVTYLYLKELRLDALVCTL